MADDPIDRHQREREAAERAARRTHPGAEDTDPPVPPRRSASRPEWPPPPIDDQRHGAGNPRSEPPIQKTHKSFVAVFGIISILFASAAAGWTAHVFVAAPLVAKTVKDELKPVMEQLGEMKKEQNVNQLANETSFAGIAKDIEWLKRVSKVVESEPIKSEKNHR